MGWGRNVFGSFWNGGNGEWSSTLGFLGGGGSAPDPEREGALLIRDFASCNFWFDSPILSRATFAVSASSTVALLGCLLFFGSVGAII